MIIDKFTTDSSKQLGLPKLLTSSEVAPSVVEEIPDNWCKCRLGDVLNLINGRAYKKEEMLSQGTPILRIQNLNGGKNWFYSDLNLPPDKYCEEGDLLYAWSATFGPYWSRWKEKLIYHYHIWNIKPSRSILKNFAFYELWRITEDIKMAAHGVAMPHITKAGMEDWEIILPPLAEQQEIASRLDTLLALVDTIKARLDGIPALLKRFRQSVLAAAVSGKLTESKEYPTSIISDIAQVIGGVTKNSKRSEIGDLRPYLRVANVYENELRLNDISEIGVTEQELKRVLLKNGDLLVVEGNGSIDQIGRVALWNGEVKDCVHQNHLIKVRADLKLANPKFLLYFMMSPQGKREIINRATSGAGLYTLSISKISSISIPLPSLSEQTEIVSHVETLFVFADQIEARVKAAQAQVNQLTQSILAKAFRGELTAEWREQHPELISGENSAEALLARIQAERGKAEKPAKAAKGRKKKQLEPAEPVADDLPAGQLSLPGFVMPEAQEAGR